MKFREYSVILLFSLILLLVAESALGQTPQYEYEYYYEDETTTVSSGAATSTVTTTTRSTTTTMKPTTTKRNGKYASVTTKRMQSQKYQSAPPDVVVNIISDMYGLRNMRLNGRPLGYQPMGGHHFTGSIGYTGYSNRYSSRYERPIEQWYLVRPDSYRPNQGRQPAVIDYGDEYNDDYADYYENYYESSSPPRSRAEAQRRGSNRAIFNFMLSALGTRRN